MSRVARLVALALAVLGAISLVVIGAAPAQAAAAPTATFASCVAGGGTADVLFLIDDSSSLKSTDPAGDRVTSAQYFIDRLRAFEVREHRTVDVRIAGFGDRYGDVGAWTALSAGTLHGVDASIASFRSRTDGFDTDYWTALHDAQADLAGHAARSSGQRCPAVVWFTDGRLDYSPRLTQAERSAYGTRKVFAPDVQLTTQGAADIVRSTAQHDLCRAGGVADQLRSSGISIFAVGLDRSGTSTQFDLIRSIATGTVGSTACGRLGGHPPGSFTRAADVQDLLFAFDAIGSPDAKPIVQEAGICGVADGVCADGAHRFVLDASTRQVQVLAAATSTGLQVRLLAPDGTLVKPASSGSGAVTAHGARVSYRWLDDEAVTIDLDEATAKGSAWSGVWQLAFVDPSSANPSGRSRTSIHIISPVAPAVIGPTPALHRGGTAELRLGLSGPGGAVDPDALLGTLDYTAVLVDSAGTSHPVLSTTDKHRVAGPHALRLDDVAVGAGSLDLTARITTAAATDRDGRRVAGTALGEKQVSVPVQVLAPARYPDVQSSADFGTITGAGTARAALRTAGSGCVWLPGGGAVAVRAGPQDVTGFRVRSGGAVSRSTCARVGATGSVPLELTASGSGNGVLNGTVRVLTAPADGTGTPVAATVAVTARYEKPLNTTNFLLALLAALLLGPGVPLLLFLLMKAVVSRIPPRPLAAALVRVRVVDGTVQRDGARFAVQAADFRGTVPLGPHGERHVDAAGVPLDVRLGRSPFGLGRVVAGTPGRLALSDTDQLKVRARGATLPLAVHDHFVLLRAPGSGRGEAELLLLLAGDAGPAEQQRLADEVDRAVPAMHDALLAEERRRGGEPADRDDLVPSSASSAASQPSDDRWSF